MTKITRVSPAPGASQGCSRNSKTSKTSPKELSNGEKCLHLFWLWEKIYRINGVTFDWPALFGKKCSLKAGTTTQVISSIHCLFLIMINTANALRYAPYLLAFSGLDAQTSVILFFLFVYVSSIWFYTTQLALQSLDFPKLAVMVSKVFQALDIRPKVRRLKQYIIMYSLCSAFSWALSVTPLCLQVLSGDAEAEGEHMSTRLLPAEANSTAFLAMMYGYVYITYFIYAGFFTLIGYLIFFCYLVGSAFGDITVRVRNLAEKGRLDLLRSKDTAKLNSTMKAFDASNMTQGADFSVEGTGLGNPARHYLQGVKDLIEVSDELELEIFHLHHSSSSNQLNKGNGSLPSNQPQNKGPPPPPQSKTVTANNKRNKNPGLKTVATAATATSAMQKGGDKIKPIPNESMTATLDVPGTLTSKNKYNSNNGRGNIDGGVGVLIGKDEEGAVDVNDKALVAMATPRKPHKQKVYLDEGNLVKGRYFEGHRGEGHRGGEKGDNTFFPALISPREVALNGHGEIWHTKSTDDLLMTSEPEVEVNPIPFPEVNIYDVLERHAFSCEIEFLRYYHLQLMEAVVLSDRILGSVIFGVYWLGILMACFALYSLVVGAFPSSEYFTLCIAMASVVLQTTLCTSAGSFLNEKAHEQEHALFSLNICALPEDQFKSVTAFISQVQREHIGITAFGLFPVNRPTYLTIVGTIITYAVVVLQFNVSCEVKNLASLTNSTAIGTN